MASNEKPTVQLSPPSQSGQQPAQQSQQTQQPSGAQQPPGRLQLNFGFMQDQSFAADMGRAFPTTPSTFPQPMYPNASGQRETWGAQSGVTGPNGYGNAGYFMNNSYPAAYPTAAATPGVTSAITGTAGGLSPVGPGTTSGAPSPYSRSTTPSGLNDGTNGLVHQFSHQNLGGNSPRSASPFGRQPSPASGATASNGTGVAPAAAVQTTTSRPRTAGQPAAPVVTIPANHAACCEETLPPRNTEKYPDNTYKRAKASQGLVSAFFKENVQRARDRNERAKDLETFLRDPAVPEARKEQKRVAMKRAEAQYLRFLRTKEKPQNFQTVKIIGKGAFGEVKLVQRKSDGKIYALKSLVKSEMFRRDQLAHVRSERDILAESDSPWVVKLYTTFQDTSFLYMLMEFLPGGDLMTMLIKYEIFSEDITRFYMAQLVTAIEAVHKLGFIHRHGHIKLTDFGLSTGFHKEHDQQYYQQLLSGTLKSAQRRERPQSVTLDQIQLTVSNRQQINTWRRSRRQLAYSTVGTPDYIAPEIFTGRGYDFGCDWWSVGTIMYECMIGWPPFCAEEANETYRKIVDWRRHLHFPPEQPLSEVAESFMRGLMCDAPARLGAIGGGPEIKQHPFFRGVDWSTLRRIRAPFEPKLTSAIDTQYFPIDEIPQVERQAGAGAGEYETAEMSLPFIGYTFRRFEGNR